IPWSVNTAVAQRKHLLLTKIDSGFILIAQQEKGLRARFLVFCLRTGELHSNVMPSDETTSLLPEGNSLNRRRKCCKHFSWRGILWIVFSLLLVTDVVVSIHYNLPNVSSCSPATDASNTKNTSDGTTSSPTTPPSNPPSEPRKPENEIVKINASKILLGFPITYRNEGKYCLMSTMFDCVIRHFHITSYLTDFGVFW
ncbi:hypothetical protein ACROYT_G000882, partial [Oculina patagonica]